jgi:hypothetical protein
VSLDLVDRFDNWPLAVQEVSQLLARPPPQWLKTGPYPFTSHSASLLLPVLSDNVTGTDVSDDMEVDEPRLRDVFDLVLSTTSLLGYFSQKSHYTRPTIPLWSTMIRALGRTCYPDALILYAQLTILRLRH